MLVSLQTSQFCCFFSLKDIDDLAVCERKRTSRKSIQHHKVKRAPLDWTDFGRFSPRWMDSEMWRVY